MSGIADPTQAAPEGPRPRGFRARLRPLSAVVLVVVAAIAVAGCIVTSGVVRDQEHRLLKQRTDEAALYLSSALSTVTSTLSTVAAGAALDKQSPTAFVANNTPLTKIPAGFRTLALYRTQPSVQLVAVAGAPITDNDPARSDAVRAAAGKVGLTGATVATQLFDGVAGARRLGFAYAAPHSPGYVVYAESEVHPEQQTPATSGKPFSELIAAVYAVPRVDNNQLIVASAGAGKLPLHGRVAQAQTSVGQGAPWLLVAKARHSLVGSVATATPWALLGAGLVAALLAAAVVETLARRRDYATAVADERTRELKQSLEDLAAAHDQLVRQERLAAIGELASTIGHELRNPLGVISNAHYLLRGDIGKMGDDGARDVAQRHLTTAEREVSAATVIVSDLLEFARQRDPVMTDFDAGQLLDEVLSVLPPPGGITIERVPDSGRITMIGDRDMLRQVLLNLIGNAYQAMPDGGRVRVSVGDGPRGPQFVVTDDGAGMTEEVRTKLFQPFFTTKARGVGLGLAVSRRIIDAHGGTIDVDSAPGRGSTFTVGIPRVQVPRQIVLQNEASEAPAPGARS